MKAKLFKRFIVGALIFIAALTSNVIFANQQDGKLEIEKLADGVYLHTSYAQLEGIGNYPSNGLVVLDRNDAYIVDTPWLEADTAVLLKWIGESGWTTKASISTHFHEDRTSGIEQLNQLDIATYASVLTNTFLADKHAAQATVDFSDAVFSLKSDLIEAYYPGIGHSHDNIVVWLPKAKILFGGCLVRSSSAKGMGNTADGSLVHWAESVSNVQQRYSQASIVVPGHGDSGGTELLTHTISLVNAEFVKPKPGKIRAGKD